jgi:hypothetical protein
MISSDSIEQILQVMQATAIQRTESIQTLWSGYGEIVRVHLEGGNKDSVIAKWVQPPTTRQQPRGWNTDLSHQRKLRSYQVESHWYRHYSSHLGNQCRVANCYLAHTDGNTHLFVLEDLDAAGFECRHSSLDAKGVRLVLNWLANFHASFLGASTNGLWPIGTYWHLDTRPEELAAIDDGNPLKEQAAAIDRKLVQSEFQTLVHGDAKVANFCFSPDSNRVAAVDFQYVGGGCGMKDVAYFLGSCQSEDQCERHSEQYLDHYFEQLRSALEKRKTDVSISRLESQWRSLYPFAWADFHRFLIGWCPGHHKLHRYTRQMTEQALASIS